MTYAEILQEIKKLTLSERLAVMEAALQLLREELQQHEQLLSTREKTQQQLAAAAQALCSDYTSDSELTSFTALDSEDFYETR